MSHKTFVYGTLKAGRGNHRTMERGKGVFIGPAVLEGFELFSMGGFPGIRRAPLGRVLGELYDVADIRPLDQLEGCRSTREDSFYFRENVQVALQTYDEGNEDATLVDCQTYVPQGDYSDRKAIASGEW